MIDAPANEVSSASRSLAFISIPFCVALDGVIFRDGWTWFIQRPFHAPRVTIWLGAGLSLFIALWTKNIPKPDDNDPLGRAITSVLIALVYWGAMWLIWYFGMGAV